MIFCLAPIGADILHMAASFKTRPWFVLNTLSNSIAMSKIAKLVTFEITARVVVESNAMPECEEEDAITKAIEKVKSNIDNDLCFDHCTQVVNDRECPYGTFDGEEDKP